MSSELSSHRTEVLTVKTSSRLQFIIQPFYSLRTLLQDISGMFTGFRLPGPELLLAHQMALTPGHTVTVRDPKAICRDCLQPARTEAMACMSKGTWPGKWMSPQSLLMRNTSSRPPHQRCHLRGLLRWAR